MAFALRKNRRTAFFIIALLVLCIVYLHSYVSFGLLPVKTSEKLKQFWSSAKPFSTVLLVLGTRPEAIKMAPVIMELNSRKTRFGSIVMSTGQHESMLKQVLSDFGLEDAVDLSLNIMVKNQTLTQLISALTPKLDGLFREIRPDIVLVQGDTTTAFVAALTAFNQKIPVGHIEAGLRTWDIYSPFPEEFNRQAIGNIAQYHFAATPWAAKNLLNENKKPDQIYVTGNPVVDSLRTVLKITPSENIRQLEESIKAAAKPHENAKVILLTCHRRENHFQPLIRIMQATSECLKHHEDTVVIYPVHLNPNVKASIQQSFPTAVADALFSRRKIVDPEYAHLNRLFLLEPFDYLDMVHLMELSYFIMTDSGGIQEEGVSIGKPIIILRENTERPEGVESGAAILAGTSHERIVDSFEALMRNKTMYDAMSKQQNIYGDGFAAKKIIDILETGNANYRLSPAVVDSYKSSVSLSDRSKVVIVLNVWRRTLLEMQLQLIKEQSILERYDVHIIVFQNAEHIDVWAIVQKWKAEFSAPHVLSFDFIHSKTETGYYGRFLTPLLIDSPPNSYFIIVDDDILFGKQYFQNMIRVVDEGYLATRNGRFFDKNKQEFCETGRGWDKGVQVTFEEDIEYDFGGHIWAGKIEWLRNVWKHPSPTFANAEDFWISAVLKTQYGIGTKKPRCPRPVEGSTRPDMCACSHDVAVQHEEPILGKSTLSGTRAYAMQQVMDDTGYTSLFAGKNDVIDISSNAHVYHDKAHPVFALKDTVFEHCFGWT